MTCEQRLAAALPRSTNGRYTLDELRRLPAILNLETGAAAIGMGLTQARALVAEGRFPLPLRRQGRRHKILLVDAIAYVEGRESEIVWPPADDDAARLKLADAGG